MTVFEFEKRKRYYYYIYYNIYNNNSNLTPIFKNCHLSSVIDESTKLPLSHKAGYDSYFVRTPDKVRRNARRGSLECPPRFVVMSGTIEWKASL